MAPYDDWNKPEDEDEEELQDNAFFEGKKDIILFAIDCSESMQSLYDDPQNEGKKTSHLFRALEAVMQIQKRKVIVGPNDAVGIMFFNTTRKNVNKGRGSTLYKGGTFLYQPIAQIDAPTIQDLIRLLHEAKVKHEWLSYEFPPMKEKRVPMGDVFTSCNWALRDGAPKSGVKRIFLITDEDDPHPDNSQLVTSAKTTLVDLTQAGVSMEPFFISTEDKPFDPTKFYSEILGPLIQDEDEESGDDLLPESISISRIDDLLEQMRFREMPKRSMFSIPFELADGFTIGVKGYGLVTEQKKGGYKYFTDLGDRLEVVESVATYIDEKQQIEVDKNKIVYGLPLGPPVEDNEDDDFGTRVVPRRNKVFFTAEEIKSFRTLGISPGLKLLGFKDSSELAIEDNVRHAFFIHPNEQTYSGSRRTFLALLRTLVKKNKIGLVRAVLRANASPIFCAMLPQEESVDEHGFTEPAGFHLIPYAFADDLRSAPIETAARASKEAIEAAGAWIAKLQIKNGGYPPDANPNPSLAFHYAQLEASAFREEFDSDSFEDPTRPRLDMIHKRAGALMKAWKDTLKHDESASVVFVQKAGTGTKRKADVSVGDAEIRSKYDGGQMSKLRVDQLKEFLKGKGLETSGKKADLIERVTDWLDKHNP